MTLQSDTPSTSLTIRAAQGTLSFLTTDSDGVPAFYPYLVKSGMSMSANLREAFKEQQWLRQPFGSTRLLVCSPVVLVPNDDMLRPTATDLESVYSSVVTGYKGDEKMVNELPELDVTALFAVNRDFKLVVTDHCMNVIVENIMVPVWRHLYRNYFQNGEHRRLFAYFHDRKVDVCSFERRRIHFANVFDAANAHDAIYYLLFVWKQLGMSPTSDSLHLIGDVPEREWLKSQLMRYINKVYFVNPMVDLQRSPKAAMKGMAYDMMI